LLRNKKTERLMDIIFILIGISLITGLCFLAAFFWAFQDGQFEDTSTPAMRILDQTELQNVND